MAEWVKLHSKITESEDIAALQAQDPNAALLFIMSLPVAAPWGILPRSPAVFRGRVAPMFDLSLSEIETCLRLVIDRGMYQEYTDRDGKAHLYVTTWTQNQTRQWDRVGAPPCDLPPKWEPPEDIAKAIEVSTRARRWLTAEALEAHLQDAESKTSLRQVLDLSKTSLPREGEGEEREEKETPETPTPNNLTLPAEDVAPEDLFADPFDDIPPAEPAQPERPTPPTATPDKPSRPETPEQAAIHRLWDAFELPGVPTPAKGCKPPYSSVLLLVQTHGIPLLDQLSAHVTADPTARLPDGAKPWPWFCKQARAYLSAPWKWDCSETGGRSPAGRRDQKRYCQLSDGSRDYEDEWTMTQQVGIAELLAEGNWNSGTGCTKTPARGWCCDDGWYYGSTGQAERQWRA